MFLILLTSSILLASTCFYFYCTCFWFKPWRNKGSASAHAMFLMSGSMFLVMMLKLGAFGYRIVDAKCLCPFDLAISVVLLLNSFFFFALAKGYFTVRKKQDDGTTDN